MRREARLTGNSIPEPLYKLEEDSSSKLSHDSNKMSDNSNIRKVALSKQWWQWFS